MSKNFKINGSIEISDGLTLNNLPVATRDDSSQFVEGNFVTWDAEENKFVDSGVSVTAGGTQVTVGGEIVSTFDADTKLDKWPNGTKKSALYGTNYKGNNTHRDIAEGRSLAGNGSITMYVNPDTNWGTTEVPGALWTHTPQFDNQCTNKKYVDDSITPIKSDIKKLKMITGVNLGYLAIDTMALTNGMIVPKNSVYPYVTLDSIEFSSKPNSDNFIDNLEYIQAGSSVAWPIDESLRELEGWGCGQSEFIPDRINGNKVDFVNKTFNVYYKKWTIPTESWTFIDPSEQEAVIGQFWTTALPTDLDFDNPNGDGYLARFVSNKYPIDETFSMVPNAIRIQDPESPVMSLVSPSDLDLDDYYSEDRWDANTGLLKEEYWEGYRQLATEFLKTLEVEIVYRTTEPYSIDISNLSFSDEVIGLVLQGIEENNVTVEIPDFDGTVIVQCIYTGM